MKLNILLPWICVLGLSAGMAAVFVGSRAKDTELAQLRTEAAQLEAVRAELDETQNQTKKLTAQNAELRKDTQDILRLRSEVGQLRLEKQQLAKQVVAVQSQAQLAQSQAEQAARSGNVRAAELTRLQAELLRQKAAQQNAGPDACINNLRQLDAAKQQWALENNKTAVAVPTAQEITPYLKGNVLPVCPAGGAYGINALNVVPTCSIPGHALP